MLKLKSVLTHSTSLSYYMYCIFFFRFNSDLLTEAVKRSNMMYGELHIREGRVIYVHGSVDPWHALGITQTKIPNNVAIFIEGNC